LIAGSGIIEGDSLVIMSPTQIVAAQWPGGQVVTSPPSMLDPRVPRQGDKAIIAGKMRTVQAAAPIYFPSGALIRIELRVKG
jgi:hypothetical protein